MCNKNELYPIKFQPIIKEVLWGGNKLGALLNKDLNGISNAGESWEISAVDGNMSIVGNGILKGTSIIDLINTYKESLVGHKVYQTYNNKFPLLIKFIDANDDLSVQVHPDDNLAKIRHNSFGKTEMWYVLEAEKNASLISGFALPVNKSNYTLALQSGDLISKLAKHDVQKGDIFFIPAGRIHAIGKGIMIAEIQQTSNITYRVFDYNRKNSLGQERELHTEEALEAIKFDDNNFNKIEYTPIENRVVDVIDCPYFKANVLYVTDMLYLDCANIDSFIVLMCVDGNASVRYDDVLYPLNIGETMLIPATLNNINIVSENAKILKVHL